jgi:hypothetical protein
MIHLISVMGFDFFCYYNLGNQLINLIIVQTFYSYLSASTGFLVAAFQLNCLNLDSSDFYDGL